MENLKGIGIVAVVFILTVIAAVYDIFGLNPGGIDGTGYGPIWYGVIAIAVLFAIYLYANRKK